MSRRIFLLAILLYFLLFFGIITLNGSVVALAFPLVIYLSAAYYFQPEKNNLVITREVSADCVYSGLPVVVKLTLVNNGSNLDEVLIEDSFPPQFTKIEGESRFLFSLRSGESRRIEYTLVGTRGCYILNQAKITVFESMGLVSKEYILESPVNLVVLPELKRLHQIKIRPRRTHDYVGPIPARQGGSGIDFFGIREYHVGDPLRWINWKVAARHEQTLFTNEFEQERIADVGLILDARSQSDIPGPNGSLFEHSVRVTASLADAFLNDGNRVGLLIYGRGQERTFPGYGKVQRERILRALGNARTSNNLALQSLDYLPTRFFPAHSQIVMISPLSDHDLPVLRRLRALGYSLLIISPDPVAFEASLYERNPDLDLAARIAYLERVLLLHKLQRTGIQTVDWDVSIPFCQVADTALGRLPRGSHSIGLV
jgi:uncharacterized protein (DUF58 family)